MYVEIFKSAQAGWYINPIEIKLYLHTRDITDHNDSLSSLLSCNTCWMGRTKTAECLWHHTWKRLCTKQEYPTLLSGSFHQKEEIQPRAVLYLARTWRHERQLTNKEESAQPLGFHPLLLPAWDHRLRQQSNRAVQVGLICSLQALSSFCSPHPSSSWGLWTPFPFSGFHFLPLSQGMQHCRMGQSVVLGESGAKEVMRRSYLCMCCSSGVESLKCGTVEELHSERRGRARAHSVCSHKPLQPCLMCFQGPMLDCKWLRKSKNPIFILFFYCFLIASLPSPVVLLPTFLFPYFIFIPSVFALPCYGQSQKHPVLSLRTLENGPCPEYEGLYFQHDNMCLRSYWQ